MRLIDREQVDGAARLWGLQGFSVESVEIIKEPGSSERPVPERWSKRIRLIDERKTHLCPCGSRDHEVLFEEAEERTFRDCSLGDFETYLVIRPKRLRCATGSRVEVFAWAAEGHRMTKRFFERVAALCRTTTVQEVARMCRLSWDTTARVDADAIRLGLGGDEPALWKVRWIGVDEVSRTGGHVYFTIVTDLDSGRVLYIGDGKREEALVGFFEKLGRRGSRRIRGVVSDLAPSFLAVIGRYLPKALHAIDRFHIVMWANEALNIIRRRVFGGAPKDGLGQELKVKKWILLSAGESLEPEQKTLLRRLEEVNHPLYRAYLLKEQLRGLLHYQWKYFGALRRNLRNWCAAAKEADPALAKVAARLEAHVEKVVAGFNTGMRMGIVEAINGKIDLLRRQARGYSVVDYFKLKIFQRCSLPDDPWAAIIL